jgi:hypothetical protein
MFGLAQIRLFGQVTHSNFEERKKERKNEMPRLFV